MTTKLFCMSCFGIGSMLLEEIAEVLSCFDLKKCLLRLFRFNIYCKADILCPKSYYGWNSRRAIQVLDQVFPKDATVQPNIGDYFTLVVMIQWDLIHLDWVLMYLFKTSLSSLLQTVPYFSELVRTNELCRQYSEACIELCKEMNLKVVDLWTALQKRRSG
ncbi:hypothetical protein HAX54_002552 [Datura stramonium]|uniref:Uncharacterized protein n=1 Tax=Datura stramonium TaxID=4076 RepID=A0ABS8WTV1_DATST|nr:hypothetical protein [Datura stramonium]